MKSTKFLSHLVRRLSWSEIDADYLRSMVELARAEDIEGKGLANPPKNGRDITTMTLTPKTQTSARLVSREDLTVCGMELLPIILDVYESHSGSERLKFTPEAKDADKLQRGDVLGIFEGSAQIMLQAERIMLNFLQRLSGVSTMTAKYVQALGKTQTKLLDTRKTTPGFRVLEKYAFACGGGYNHRIGLFDRVMLKDNHLAAAHAASGEMLAEAVRKARKENADVAVEVEVDSPGQIPPVLEAGADVIMLDNFNFDDMRKAVDYIGQRAYVEVSGGVTLSTIGKIGEIGPDFVSSAAPVHSSKWIDIGLDS